MPLEGEMSGNRGEVLIRFNEDEAVVDAVRGDDHIAQGH